MNKQKFYVVWTGRVPGIYLTWPDCAAQVQGFAAARYKSFPTRAAAEGAYGRRDVSGHEVDIVADHGSYAIGMELKAGMTVIPEFFKGFTLWQKLTGYEKAILYTATTKHRKEHRH